MTDDMEWQRSEAETRIGAVLNAAKAKGIQKIIDADGIFQVRFVPRKRTLEELFSKPGTVEDD